VQEAARVSFGLGDSSHDSFSTQENYRKSVPPYGVPRFSVSPYDGLTITATWAQAAGRTENLKQFGIGVHMAANAISCIPLESVFKTEMIGSSRAFRSVCNLVQMVARTDSAVLIHGETGTGKELVAKAIHEQSIRRRGPYVRVNCAA